MYLSRGVAVLFAVLVTCSLIALPVLASAPTSAPTHESSLSASKAGVLDGSPSLDGIAHPAQVESGRAEPADDLPIPAYIENATVDDLETLTPLEQRVWAVSRLQEIDPADRKAERELESAFEDVNDSLSAHVGWSRVDSADAFDRDRAALRSLRRVDADAADEVGVALVAADRGATQRAVEDAEYVLDRFGDDVETPGQREKVERHLENAYRALERGDERTSGTDVSLQDRRSAIEQYERAWVHAQTAIETVHDEAGLSLSVAASQHEPGADAITYPISGEISAPAANVSAVDVYIDGAHHETVGVDGSAAPGAVETFETRLVLERTRANVTVVATDEANGETVSETITVAAPGFADETYTVRPTDPESGVTVHVTGEGLVESDVEVDAVPPEMNRSFHAGSFVHVRNHTNFDNATVEIPLAEGVDPADGELAIYKWDQHDDDPWHRVETEIDAENGTATAEVDSFSYFSVFWVDNWDDAFSTTTTLDDEDVTDGGGTVESIDLAFVLDVSGSMGGARIDNAKAASKRFVGGLYEEDEVAVASFSSTGELEQPLTTDYDAVNASIDRLTAGGSTNTGAGLQAAIDELVANGDADEQEIVLLADGHTNAGPNPVSVAEAAAAEGITINTIGVGSGVDANELTTIADVTGGEYYHVADSADLPEVFDRVQDERFSLVDTDEDGIPDAVEEMDLAMPVGGPDMLGSSLGLDPDAQDSAGDGRLDSDVVDVEWLVTEGDNGTKEITAQVDDAVFHPGTGEPVTREVIKIGYFLPTEADLESEDPVTSAVIDRAQGEGYAVAPANDDIPSDRWRHDWWWIFDSDPSWLPDDVVDSELYHMQLEPVVVVQYTHDVRTEDLPESYEIGFTDSDVHVYDESGSFAYDSGYTRTEVVVAAPSGMDDYVASAYSSVGRSELTVDMTGTELGREVTAQSEYRYIYDTDAAERYEQVYNEAWMIFEEGMQASYSLATAPTRWAAMRAAETMTQKNLIRALNNADSILGVLEGEDQTGYDDFQSDIYDEYGVSDETGVVSTGPVIAIDLTDYDATVGDETDGVR
ncbi:VWA domain-containing protein [Saliphagus sp. GCM10025334]